MKIEQSIGDPAFLVEKYYDTMQENDALKNRVRNLELYLDYVKQKAPKLWEEMPDGEELCKELIKAIHHAPTVDAVPVKHGRWKERATGLFRCSECDSLSPYKFKYCRECGADMRRRKHEIHSGV